MQQQKIKRFLAHFVLDHVTIEYLKYGHQLTIEQLKLLIFILHFTENHKEDLSLNMIIFYKNYQKKLHIYMNLIGFQKNDIHTTNVD